nr:hypothetical protein [uncultured Mediterraneibacter sp.]
MIKATTEIVNERAKVRVSASGGPGTLMDEYGAITNSLFNGISRIMGKTLGKAYLMETVEKAIEEVE